MSGTEKARGGGLFKVTVPQMVEEIAVFNYSKKCFSCSDNFRRKACIFCAAVVNKKAFWQRKNCDAIGKDRRHGSEGQMITF